MATELVNLHHDVICPSLLQSKTHLAQWCQRGYKENYLDTKSSYANKTEHGDQPRRRIGPAICLKLPGSEKLQPSLNFPEQKEKKPCPSDKLSLGPNQLYSSLVKLSPLNPIQHSPNLLQETIASQQAVHKLAKKKGKKKRLS